MPGHVQGAPFARWVVRLLSVSQGPVVRSLELNSASIAEKAQQFESIAKRHWWKLVPEMPKSRPYAAIFFIPSLSMDGVQQRVRDNSGRIGAGQIANISNPMLAICRQFAHYGDVSDTKLKAGAEG